ncbi:hypothetical protein [Azospirillum agricola]|uniref:hypothetical protein n=1 Tax=Azospirillum agricola TaxID=1720247 RepID=UPI000A0F3C81|nr:hypothetical protein [Azospirillum agricola]SMH62583.1 hypothetical protein SAMN02982994_6388 [Azospirillum lipoferum]
MAALKLSRGLKAMGATGSVNPDGPVATDRPGFNMDRSRHTREQDGGPDATGLALLLGGATLVLGLLAMLPAGMA